MSCGPWLKGRRSGVGGMMDKTMKSSAASRAMECERSIGVL